ncbi:hypothetical protein NPIL_183491 [Nephila pilipes]|uniref:Uncharacterized protein n=1 Tax=Nephila pilipes TaxID=299642 RepID=A0A8X6P6K2_NEPPI|nr:hypothetical protein NPIL_183491 [Nephila pilipes]
MGVPEERLSAQAYLYHPNYPDTIVNHKDSSSSFMGFFRLHLTAREYVNILPTSFILRCTQPVIRLTIPLINKDGLLIEKLDCSKFTGKVPYNNEALQEMDRMGNYRPPSAS